MDILLRKAESIACGDLNAEPAEATDAERRMVLLKLQADEEAKDQRPPERKRGRAFGPEHRQPPARQACCEAARLSRLGGVG